MCFKVLVIVFCFCFLNFPINSWTHDVPQQYEKLIFEMTGKNETATSVILDQLINVDIATLSQMFDASAKLPDGILTGNFYALGNFDECYGIKSQTAENGVIYGKYCLGAYPISVGMSTKETLLLPNAMQLHPQQSLLNSGSNGYVAFSWGICIPSFLDIDEFLFLKIDPDFCYSKATERSLDPWAIATIAILAFFGGLVVVSTVFDIILYYRNQKPAHELLVAFSFLTNGRKLFSYTSNSQQLLCLNGIKAISMMWVILGHIFERSAQAPLINLLDFPKWQDKTVNMVLLGATVSVDTFFTVGGMLTVYTFLKSIDKGAKFNIFLYYIHRYLRLTPAFLISAMVYMNLLNYFGNGPLWALVDIVLVRPCKKAWWQSSLLYISNFTDEYCVPQGWYLMVDMQLFILSPLVLIPLWKKQKIGLGLLGVLALAGVLIPCIITAVFNLNNSQFINDNHYYMQTYTRFGPYVIGMILGYLIYVAKKTEKRIHLAPVQVCILWITGMAGLLACLFAGHDISTGKTDDKFSNVFFIGFNRNAWAVALSIIIYLCVTGHGGPVDGFLSLPIFQFLSKVSYSMYLIHYAVITVRGSSTKVQEQFSNMTYFHKFWGDFMFTLAISVILCLTFESPVIIIEKYIFKRESTRDPEQTLKAAKIDA